MQVISFTTSNILVRVFSEITALMLISSLELTISAATAVILADKIDGQQQEMRCLICQTD